MSRFDDYRDKYKHAKLERRKWDSAIELSDS